MWAIVLLLYIVQSVYIHIGIFLKKRERQMQENTHTHPESEGERKREDEGPRGERTARVCFDTKKGIELI